MLGGVSSAPTIDDADVAYWRARAERAEARAEGFQARIEELSEQVAVLSRMLFGRSSEKNGSSSGAGDEPGDQQAPDTGEARESGRRGQRPGGKGHRRRDYSHLDTREEIHEVSQAQRTCAGCGAGFEPLGTEDSEQIDWQVTITADRASAAPVPAPLHVSRAAHGDRPGAAQTDRQGPVHRRFPGPTVV